MDNDFETTKLKNTQIYLDHNATTPLASEVKESINEAMDSYGNPSSNYASGGQSREFLVNARKHVALSINGTPETIVFTGGGSESNNLAIKGIAYVSGKKHIITSSIEHPSVLNTCQWLEKQGFSLTYLPVNREGQVNPDDLTSSLTDHTCLVSIMLANNETGVIQPIGELSRIARKAGVLFHTDAVQAVGKIPVDVSELGTDMLSLSAHKFGGPKGVGALFVGEKIWLEPLIHGGGQEHGLRAGTENVTGIAGIGKAAELIPDRVSKMKEVRELKDQLFEGILCTVPHTRSVGNPATCLPNTLCILLPGIQGESLVNALDLEGIAISAGAACHSGTPHSSHVLEAMGFTKEEAQCIIRVSLGPSNTREEIDQTLKVMKKVISELIG